jgi:hypothetical protein
MYSATGGELLDFLNNYQLLTTALSMRCGREVMPPIFFSQKL